MIRSIVCAVGAFENSDGPKRAIALAAAHDVHLSFAVIGFSPPPPAALYYSVSMETWSEEHKTGLKQLALKGEELEELLQDLRVSGDVSQHFIYRGEVARVIGLRARFADIGLLFPETATTIELRPLILPGLVFESGGPFMTIPHDLTPTLAPKSVLIGWNDFIEAAKAVHSCLGMLAGAEKVTVLMVDPIESEWLAGEEPGFDIASFLARHDVKVTVDRLPSGGRNPADVILRHATDIGADLVVAGAYGHSRMREWIFGGATKCLLEQAKIPVLFAH